ncbi:MAG TPA: HAD-IIIA family hydrolase, partial [Phycisphaerales bacterium]|nr:HAD-IIIA family hydrolase [Phycisphaerales bacterium]
DARRAGYACIVVSNQSGVGRGMLTEVDMWAVQREVERQLIASHPDAVLDAAYFCTFAPPKDTDSAPDRRSRIDHPDRKPAPGMLLRASQAHGLDLARSWMIGDMESDILAGKNAGVGATIHVLTGHGRSQPSASAIATHTAADLAEAIGLILSSGRA